MTSRRSLPPEVSPPFSVGAALELGVSVHRLEAVDLRRPFHGTRTSASAPDNLETDCGALATRFRPGDAFTGPTAARLWGMPLPSGLERSPLLFVSSRSPTRALRRQGVVASTRFSGDPHLTRGQPVMSVWETCLALGPLLRRDDLTAVIDFAVTGDRGRNPLSSLGSLDDFLMSSRRRPGLSALRRARGMARRGAWSRPETHLRLVCLRASLPEPVLNASLNHPSGRELIPDLGWPEYRVAAEYNGIHHEKSEQRVHDLRRIDDFTDIGWSTVNVERNELYRHPDSAVARIVRRLIEHGWTPPRGFRLPTSASW